MTGRESIRLVLLAQGKLIQFLIPARNLKQKQPPRGYINYEWMAT